MSVYNGATHLEGSINSVLNQTYKNFEFIIFNDGSTDNSLEIINSFAIKDDRIVVYTTKNLGLTKCLIKAIKFSKYDFIARIDADDEMKPERLQKQLEFISRKKDIGLVFSGVELIDNYGQFLKKVNYKFYSSLLIKKRLLFSNIIIHGSTLFRKSVYNQVGGYCEFFKYSQDYDLWLRISEFSKIKCLNESLYILKIHDNSISVKKEKLQLEYASLGLYRYIRKIDCKELYDIDNSYNNDLKFNAIKFRFAIIRSNMKLAREILYSLPFYYKIYYYLLIPIIFFKKFLK